MSANAYHFVTHWRVPGTVLEVHDILAEALDLPRWWPSVYLDVAELTHGDDDTGIGREFALYTKGWLPYGLRWSFRVTDSRPDGFGLEAWGDFVGRGEWSFVQDGPFVDITYDWQVRADKPLLRRFSRLFKPVFAANHHWAMARGQESLLLELRRRAAASPAERAAVPSPPAPSNFRAVILGAPIAAAALLVVLRRRR